MLLPWAKALQSCRNLDDIVYINQMERMPEHKSNMTENTRMLLKSYLWTDYILYDHFYAKLLQKIEQIGKVNHSFPVVN